MIAKLCAGLTIPVFAAALTAQSGPNPSADAGAVKPPRKEVTFTKHIAKIIFKHCTSCHRQGEAAPFALETYEDVRKKARTIRAVTKRRYMPPWHPVKGHGEFADERRMSQREISLIGKWIADGTPKGNEEDMPKMPNFPKGWQLGEPDLVVKMRKGFPVPADGPDIYRNFVVPLNLQEDKWLTAVEVRPGSSVLHHIVFQLGDDKALEMQSTDGKPGFSSMRFAGRRARLGVSTAGLGGWAVGGTPRHLPMGLARKLPKGSSLILNTHFHPTGKAETEQTKLGLYFAKKPPKQQMVGLQLPPFFGIMAGLEIPPGKKLHEIRGEFTLPVDALAVTVGGHAHYLCKTMEVLITKPGRKKPKSIFYIDDWDFDWQQRYQYKRPMLLPAGTKIEAIVSYDNSPDNPNQQFDPPKRISWGLQSTDEMGSVTLLMVAKREKDRRRLERAIRSNMRPKDRKKAAGGFASMILSSLKMMDRNGDGIIQSDEIPARQRRMVGRIDTNGDGDIDKEEMAELERQIKEGGWGRRRRRR